MEVLPPSFTFSDIDKVNLEQLLDMFGTVVSLEDIASAYCEADRNLHSACHILCNLQGSSAEETDSPYPLKADTPRAVSADKVLEKPQLESKAKRASASTGTVSSVIRRGYFRLKPPIKESSEVPKPLKLRADEFPVAEIWDEKDTGESTRISETMHLDVANFLFKMLGDGFNLNIEIIQDVVGQCGCDVQKSMEKLLDLSAPNFQTHEDIPIILQSQKPMVDNEAGCLETSSDVSSGSLTANSEMGTEMHLASISEGPDILKEILRSLFSESKRIPEELKRTNKGVRRPRAFGQLVASPPEDPQLPSIVTRRQIIEKALGDDDLESNFELQKGAAKEYSNTMTEYFKAATEAFIAEDFRKADILLEEGQFFRKKSWEAYEKATQILIQTRDIEEQITIDLCYFCPKEAVRHLKVQLTSLTGIPTIHHLKLIIGNKDEDTKAARRKRLITKLLETESLTWKEEDNGQAIVVPVANINPKRLKFAKSN